MAAVEGVRLRTESQRVVDAAPGGNDDGRLDPGETITLPVTLLNAGRDGATGVTGALTSNRPTWARITRPSALWPDLPSREAAESLAPHFELTLFPEAACGERVTFTLTADSATSEPSDSFFTLPIGNPNRDYPDGPPADIPAAAFDFVSSPLVIGDEVNVAEMDVSVDIRHGNIGELRVFLVSPSGTQVVLHDRSSEGTSDLIARFDLDRPGSLGDFVGEPAQGEWTLAISDTRNSGVPAGRLEGWTLHLTGDSALSCSPRECGEPTPAAIDPGLSLQKAGEDVTFAWPTLAGTSGYHVLRATTPLFDDPRLVGRTEGATTLDATGEAVPGEPGTVQWYVVRAINSCGWEGP